MTPENAAGQPAQRAGLAPENAELLASRGATLHQLRHSAMTRDAEDGTGTPMLMARSGHTSGRSLAKYARVSAEALARHQAERDPAPDLGDIRLAGRRLRGCPWSSVGDEGPGPGGR